MRRHWDRSQIVSSLQLVRKISVLGAQLVKCELADYGVTEGVCRLIVWVCKGLVV